MMLSRLYIWILTQVFRRDKSDDQRKFVVYSDEYRAYHKGSRVYTAKKEEAVVYDSQKKALSDILKLKIRDAAAIML